jgi:hypothetical protein
MASFDSLCDLVDSVETAACHDCCLDQTHIAILVEEEMRLSVIEKFILSNLEIVKELRKRDDCDCV